MDATTFSETFRARLAPLGFAYGADYNGDNAQHQATHKTSSKSVTKRTVELRILSTGVSQQTTVRRGPDAIEIVRKTAAGLLGVPLDEASKRVVLVSAGRVLGPDEDVFADLKALLIHAFDRRAVTAMLSGENAPIGSTVEPFVPSDTLCADLVRLMTAHGHPQPADAAARMIAVLNAL